MIVFVHLLNDFSGSPRVLKDIVEISVKQAPVMLYHGSNGVGVLDEVKVAKKKFFYRRSRFKFLTLISYLISQGSLYRSLSKNKYISESTVIYVNTLLPFGAIIWGKLNNHKVIVHTHEVSISPAPLRHFLTSVTAKFADKVLFVSNDHKSRLDIKNSNLEVMPNTTSSAVTVRAAEVKYLPRRSGYFDVLMLTSLKDYKGINEYIALVDFFTDRRDMRFTLVLSGADIELDVFINCNLKYKNLRIFKNVKNPEEYYTECDLLLNLSRPDQWIETFGLTILEAMTFGVPVIVPTVGGPIELVTNGREGFCIDSNDFNNLVEHILKISETPKLAKQLSLAASHRAKDFDRKTFEKRLTCILDEINKDWRN